MSICMCGSMAGYPHDPACPWPLYREWEPEYSKWQKEYANRKAGLTPPTMEEPESPTPVIAPQNPVEDFFNVR